MNTHRMYECETYFDTRSELTLVSIDHKRIEKHGLVTALRTVCAEFTPLFQLEHQTGSPDSPITFMLFRRDAPGRANSMLGVIVKHKPIVAQDVYAHMAGVAWEIASYMFRNGCESISVPRGQMFGEGTDWDDVANPIWLAAQWLPGCTMERIQMPLSRRELF